MSENATPASETHTGTTSTPATTTTTDPGGATSPQASATTTQTTPITTTGETSGEEEEFDRERAMKTIRALREKEKAATAAQKELETLREEKRQADLAKLSEQERLTKRAEEAETALQEAQRRQQDRINRYEVQLQASRLGIVDPDAAVKLLDWSSLEFAADGTPKDVEAALAQLIADRPYLAAPAQAQAQAQTPARTAANPTNGATRAQTPGQRTYTAAQLDDRAFYLSNREDIQKAYREGRITN